MNFHLVCKVLIPHPAISSPFIEGAGGKREGSVGAVCIVHNALSKLYMIWQLIHSYIINHSALFWDLIASSYSSLSERKKKLYKVPLSELREV